MKNNLATQPLFLITVLLPTLFITLYFGLLASDIYISESCFVVRSPAKQNTSTLTTLLQGSGFSRSQDDAYAVQNFILSRDALKNLNDQLQLKTIFSNHDIDAVRRFAGLPPWDDSFESLHRYYKNNIVSLTLDSASSIVTLSIRAFSAKDAFRINQQLLEMSEALVNQLNERGRQDMIRYATGEVAQAENKAKAATLALSNYRNLREVINPEQQSMIHLQQVAKLQDELIATQAQLTQLLSITPGNSQIAPLQQRVQNLRHEIDVETKRIAGGNRSLADKAAEYQRLALEQGFADKQLMSALASLEQARNDAQRKQLYLERVAQPSTPDKAMEPRRLRSILATFTIGMILYGVLSMLIAGIREHQD